MKTHVFIPDREKIRAAHRAGEPKTFIAEVQEQIGPVLEYISIVTHKKDIPALRWMLTELTINANAALERSPAGDDEPSTSELAIVATVRESSRDFEVLVKNSGKPTEKDRCEIARRFRDYTGTRREIEALREKHTEADGIVKIPGTTGGGGLAILECIRRAKESGLFFAFYIDSQTRPMTVFRIASYPIECANKSSDMVQQAGRGGAENRAPRP